MPLESVDLRSKISPHPVKANTMQLAVDLARTRQRNTNLLAHLLSFYSLVVNPSFPDLGYQNSKCIGLQDSGSHSCDHNPSSRTEPCYQLCFSSSQTHIVGLVSLHNYISQLPNKSALIYSCSYSIISVSLENPNISYLLTSLCQQMKKKKKNIN